MVIAKTMLKEADKDSGKGSHEGVKVYQTPSAPRGQGQEVKRVRTHTGWATSISSIAKEPPGSDRSSISGRGFIVQVEEEEVEEVEEEVEEVEEEAEVCWCLHALLS